MPLLLLLPKPTHTTTLIHRIQTKSSKYPLHHQSNHPTSIHTKPHLHKPQSIQNHIIFPSLISAMISKHSKSRTKIRKPKYLSLNHHLTTTTPPPMPTTNHHDDHKQQQLTLFPLHPENLVEQDHNMASIFSTCDNSTTLTEILCSENDDEENRNNLNPSPSSVNYAHENVELVRTAMRKNKTENIDQNNNDDHDDEKWVCYSEVCSSISSTTNTTPTSCHHNIKHYRSKLVLKLDYEKIMKSWVNKGPLFIRGDSDVDAPYPQTVPDLHDDDFFLHSSDVNVRSISSWFFFFFMINNKVAG